uniref:RRM domain-containing protein n=1 Tax=Caenorhabditis tropicalis TaxID=1561998 RepID=A0A1I7TBF4_9PELO
MVKRIFVQGLNSDTTEATVRKYFENFGKLYECVVPIPTRYAVEDTGPDDEEIEQRSSIRYKSVGSQDVLDNELNVSPYDSEKHGSFENYMKKIGEGELFSESSKPVCAGYAYITFVDMDGFSRCMKSDIHEIDRARCTVEQAKDDENGTIKVDSKRLFVSFFPLDRLTGQELKTSFRSYGKITDVEFVSDNQGPLHFCIITFADSSSVDTIISKSIYIRGVLLFTRRAVLKEFIKIAEHKVKVQSQLQKVQLLPNHTAYPMPSQPVSSYSSSFSSQQPYDPSAAAGYAPLYSQTEVSETDPNSQYGYGPRKW